MEMSDIQAIKNATNNLERHIKARRWLENHGAQAHKPTVDSLNTYTVTVVPHLCSGLPGAQEASILMNEYLRARMGEMFDAVMASLDAEQQRLTDELTRAVLGNVTPEPDTAISRAIMAV